MDALRATYRRGQVEQAIARIHRVATFDGQAPQGLRSDLKRLLDIDRTPRSEKLKGNTDPNAFYDNSDGPKKGSEVSYRAFHAFALLIAYRLAETGMTQSRVVGFMRDIRDVLESFFDQLVMSGPADLQPNLSEDALNRRVLAGDLLQQSDANANANAMTFLIARAGSKPAKFNRMDPIYGDIVAGNICSFAELSGHLMRFDEQREGIVVLGLTNAAHQVVAMLAKTEAPRRGRPSSRKQESR